MAYCTNCGAYIPDGETVCVACGTSVKAAQAATQAQQAAQNARDDLYATLEHTQQKQKEQTQQWAAQAGTGSQSHSTSQNVGGTPTADKPSGAVGSGILSTLKKSKVLAALSYFGIICFLPLIVSPDDDFAKYHAKQGIVLLVCSLAIDFIASFSSGIAGLLSLARIYLIYRGLMNATHNRKEELPYIGKYASKLKF